MAPTSEKAAFFDVDNTLVRGSTLYFLGRGMYQRGFFTKADISRFVVANIRFRMTGTEKKEVIEKFQNAATDFIGGHAVRGGLCVDLYCVSFCRRLAGLAHAKTGERCRFAPG